MQCYLVSDRHGSVGDLFLVCTHGSRISTADRLRVAIASRVGTVRGRPAPATGLRFEVGRKIRTFLQLERQLFNRHCRPLPIDDYWFPVAVMDLGLPLTALFNCPHP